MVMRTKEKKRTKKETEKKNKSRYKILTIFKKTTGEKNKENGSLLLITSQRLQAYHQSI